MYWANYISEGLSWRMPMDERLSKGCAAYGKAWNIMEDSGRVWTCVIKVRTWILMDD